jgi:outer membrane protein, multidrug efflux system
MKRGVLALSGLLLGCASAPARPEVPLPSHWSTQPAQPVRPHAASAPELWALFQCPELRSLLTAAGKQHPDAAAAEARVQQAEALSRVARAPLYPSLSAAFELVGQSDNGKNLGSIRGGFADLGVMAAYEVDIWGDQRRRVESADARTEISRFERASMQLSISVGVAELYFEVLSLRERLAAAQRNMTATQQVLAVVEARARSGVAYEREVSQQKALVAGEAAAVEQLAAAEAETRVTLALALGQPESQLTVAAQSLDAVADVSIDEVDLGVPERLLGHRPDVARAEAQLAGAHADVQAARASFLPSLRVVGSAAWQSVFLSQWENGSQLVYSGALSISQPLFDGGDLRGQRDAALARQAEVQAEYRSAVLSAAADVERGLRAWNGARKQLEQQRVVVDEARRAFELIQVEYQGGAGELLSVLDAQRTLFRAQDALSQLRLLKLRAAVSLVRALGGGWSAPVFAER